MNRPAKPQYSMLSPLWFLIFIAVIFITDLVELRRNTETVPYNQFLTYLDEGKVSEIAVGSEQITGTLKDTPKGHPKNFSTFKMEDQNALTQRLTKAHVQFGALPQRSLINTVFSWVWPLLLVSFIFSYFFKRAGAGVGAGSGLLPLGKSKAKVYAETDLKTRFDDVAGVDEAKAELREIVEFLKDPTRFSKLGGRMPKGIMLVGPPGTGKTLLARAVAGEAGVPFFSINGSEFVELFVGLGAARVRDLFAEGRKAAPCIIFIDELDALGKARGISAITGSANDEKEQTLNQLLAEMDGFDPAQGIVLLAATNRPEILDPALLRAGRFDRNILVDKPDRSGREKILKIHLRKIKLASGVDLASLAGMTAGFSGADLANLANEAALVATRRSAASVELRDFTEAIERIVAGLERKSRLLNPEEKKRVAYHEMGHAVVALALGESEVVHKVSIIPRGISALGYTMRRPTEDRYLMSRPELEAKMAIALGGRAAEMIFFKDISTGAGDDLDKATEIARAMVTRYGMEIETGLAVFEREPSPMLGSQLPTRTFDYSDETAKKIDQAIQDLLNHSLELALDVLNRFIPMIKEAALQLLEKETIDETGLKALWDKYNKHKEQKETKMRQNHTEVLISNQKIKLPGDLAIPTDAIGLVIFAHGSGSSRHSPRNVQVANRLHEVGLATLLFDLLTVDEADDRDNVFDIPLLASRLVMATHWAASQPKLKHLSIGYFGASTGAAAALQAAGKLGSAISAVVSRGGRPDLAGPSIVLVKCPTLLLVGQNDEAVVEMNRDVLPLLTNGELMIIPGATHLFEEPGTLEQVASEAAQWFSRFLSKARQNAA